MTVIRDDSIVSHMRLPYDPQAAHEYYIRNRKLHPREKSSAPVKVNRSTKYSYTVRDDRGTHTLTSAAFAEQKSYAAHRTAELKARLADLSKQLRSRLDAAAKTERKANHKPSAADKAQSARDSKAYRAKHKTALAAKAKAASKEHPRKPTKSVAELKKEIISTKNDLKAAVEKQRQLATAKKNG